MLTLKKGSYVTFKEHLYQKLALVMIWIGISIRKAARYVFKFCLLILVFVLRNCLLSHRFFFLLFVPLELFYIFVIVLTLKINI